MMVPKITDVESNIATKFLNPLPLISSHSLKRLKDRISSFQKVCLRKLLVQESCSLSIHMIMDLNSYPSPLPIEPSKYDYQNQELHPFVPYNQVSSSSSSSSCVFFDTVQDQTGRYEHHLCPVVQHHQDHNYAYNGGSPTTCEVEWKNEDPGDMPPEIKWKNDANPVKLTSSKMRLMRKMKNHDGLGLNLTSYCTTKRSSYLGTDSSNNISSHDNIPIRVCSDCNTTKTPLWRSGPKGPKSLCNACGIKQRKARRAAMAAAASKDAVVAAAKPRALVKIKMQHEEKATAEIPMASPLKERSVTAGSKYKIGQKKLGHVEDLLMNLSKNLTFHRVFPDDEMDAAILLMALSSGLG